MRSESNGNTEKRTKIERKNEPIVYRTIWMSEAGTDNRPSILLHVNFRSITSRFASHCPPHRPFVLELPVTVPRYACIVRHQTFIQLLLDREQKNWVKRRKSILAFHSVGFNKSRCHSVISSSHSKRFDACNNVSNASIASRVAANWSTHRSCFVDAFVVDRVHSLLMQWVKINQKKEYK